MEKLDKAVREALATEDAGEVLKFLTGAFVGLTVALLERQGHITSNEIHIDGGARRDITIHAEKD